MASFTLCWLFLQLGKIPPLHFTSVGMTCRWVVSFIHTGYNCRVAWRWIIAATLRGSVHPHRLYMQRGGRQIAAPTDTPACDTIHPHRLYSQRSMCCRPSFLSQRKSPTGRFGEPLPWGCWLFGADAPGVDLGDFRLFVQEDQVGVFAGGDGAFGFPQAHFPGGVFRQGGEDLFQG